MVDHSAKVERGLDFYDNDNSSQILLLLRKSKFHPRTSTLYPTFTALKPVVFEPPLSEVIALEVRKFA
jgi:hypothetical protein